MSNEWNQCPCKFTPPDPAGPPQAPGWWPPAAATPAWHTPVWDSLFEIVHKEDTSAHLMSIHNNAYLFNYSRPWFTHMSVQHTHNKPQDMWSLYRRMPFVWDEVKYEGDNTQNWGSLSAPQMVHRMWWGAATGAYGGHGEVLALPTAECDYGANQWSGNGGKLCGESPKRIAWFRDYIENTTIHPPFEECEGSDDGYVQALHCGTDFHLFRFYNSAPFCNMCAPQRASAFASLLGEIAVLSRHVVSAQELQADQPAAERAAQAGAARPVADARLADLVRARSVPAARRHRRRGGGGAASRRAAAAAARGAAPTKPRPAARLGAGRDHGGRR